jgi:serine/threonine protein kinase
VFVIRNGEVLASRYRLDGPQEQGGMSTIWRAYDERLGRAVAVKFLDPTRAATSEQRTEMVKRFQQEVAIHARFPGNAVPVIYDAGQQGGTFYLVMELIQGTSLEEFLCENDYPQDPEVAASIVVPICGVLAAAHQEGIVHRDLKPSNVMISHRGETKLLDFGIARVEGAEEDTRLTSMGNNPGSPEYMSPEQIRGEEVTGRSDLYSLGCLLYRILAGRRVFDERNEFVLKNMHLSAPPVPLDHWVPGLPEELVNLVTRLLAKNPAERPASADEVNNVLRRHLPERGAASPLGSDVNDPSLPFRFPYAPEERPLTGPRVELPSVARPAYRPRSEIKDLHHRARALVTDEPALAVTVVEENLPKLLDLYGALDSGVLDLRFDLADALLAFGARAGARASYLEIEADTVGVPGLELYHSRAEEGIAASE